MEMWRSSVLVVLVPFSSYWLAVRVTSKRERAQELAFSRARKHANNAGETGEGRLGEIASNLDAFGSCINAEET